MLDRLSESIFWILKEALEAEQRKPPRTDNRQHHGRIMNGTTDGLRTVPGTDHGRRQERAKDSSTHGTTDGPRVDHRPRFVRTTDAPRTVLQVS